MATINRQVLEDVAKQFRAIHTAELELNGEGELIKNLAMIVESNSAEEVYDWLNDFAEMREWVGERKLGDVKAYTYRIPNKLFEVTKKLKRVDLEDDKLGLYDPIIRGITQAYYRKRRRDMVALLTANGNGYDGVPFFSANHPRAVDLPAQSNIKSGSGSDLSGENIDAAMEAGELLTDDAGNPLDIRYDTLVVGPKLRAKVRTLFEVRTTANGAENEYAGFFKNIIIEPALGTSTSWYLFDTSKVLKPFIVQNREAPELTMITNPDADSVFDTDAFKYGVRARYGMGYGFWQLAYMGQGQAA